MKCSTDSSFINNVGILFKSDNIAETVFKKLIVYIT